MASESYNNCLKIDKLIRRLEKFSSKGVEKALEKLLDWGLQKCLDNHDTLHQQHLVIDGGYGWILLHDGQEVKRKVVSRKGSASTDANEQLTRAAGSVGAGWQGFVLASMNPVTLFSLRYEYIPMGEAIRELKSLDFSQYFKPVKR